MAAPLPVALGEIFAEKYRVESVIGEGGMGVVVLAHHLELDQPVAIKFLLDNVADSAEGAERFRREARAAAKIQSDHVTRVYDVGILPNGVRYMVMEYLKGRDLADELTLHGALPISYGARLMLEVLEAMNEAHSAGIVHRDLKPGNVFLSQRADGRIRVKVLDFGISKAVGLSSASDLSLTKTSAWMGSPLYMAPEQMQSARDVDARADIWSFGAIFYEVLSGEPPYVAESLPQLCALLLSQDPKPLSTKRPDVPADLEQLVMRCLSRDPAKRYQNATELLGPLQLCLARITSSGRDSSPGSLTPIASRLPTVTSMGAASTVLAEPSVDRHLVAPPPPGIITQPSADNPTNGNWTSTNGSRGASTTDPGPEPRSQVRPWLPWLAALLVVSAAGAAWLSLRPPGAEALAPEASEVDRASSERAAGVVSPVVPGDSASVKPGELGSEPPGQATEHAATGQSADEGSPTDGPNDRATSHPGAEGTKTSAPSTAKARHAYRPVTSSTHTAPPDVKPPEPPAITAPAKVEPVRAEPARPNKLDELDRFGGRR